MHIAQYKFIHIVQPIRVFREFASEHSTFHSFWIEIPRIFWYKFKFCIQKTIYPKDILQYLVYKRIVAQIRLNNAILKILIECWRSQTRTMECNVSKQGSDWLAISHNQFMFHVKIKTKLTQNIF